MVWILCLCCNLVLNPPTVEAFDSSLHVTAQNEIQFFQQFYLNHTYNEGCLPDKSPVNEQIIKSCNLCLFLFLFFYFFFFLSF